jgi:mono/diheme cytochrome c family protein
MFTVGLGAFGLLVAAEGSASRSQSTFRDAPDTTTSWSNPFAGQHDAVLAGEKLFRHHCAECHGDDAAGRDRAPSLRAPTVQSAPPGALFWFLTNGDLTRGMPAWSRLPDQRRWQLVTYLQSLGPLATPCAPRLKRLS